MKEFVLYTLLIGLPVCAAVFGVVYSRERRRRIRIEQMLQQKERDVDRTSKMLIEKNLELSDQNMRLEKLLEAKTDFVGIASHQLRTPITEIRWGLEILLDGTFGTFADGQHDHLVKILASSKKMIRLIDDLLRLVHIEAGYRAYSIDMHDLDALVHSVGEETQHRFESKNIKLVYDFTMGGDKIPFDTDMIEIALTNLITNAFHYTPPHGEVRLSTRLEGKSVHLDIKDSGVGIPKERQGELFKKFQRSEMALEMNAEGIGLGLYIAKNIIEQHHGSITFESEIGKGTTFSIVLPLE